VHRAFAVSRKAGYVSFCRNETGRLLAALAATRGGTLAEFGTGCGVGTAWLRSGSARRRAHRHRRARPQAGQGRRRDLRGRPAGRGRGRRLVDAVRQGPFSLLFLDSGKPSAVGPEKVWDLVEEGGIVVLDDFTPCEHWPPTYAGRVDTLREEWLSDERFAAVEVMIAPDASAVIATRR
jgi:predicted O-methyltransferase YrrM